MKMKWKNVKSVVEACSRREKLIDSMEEDIYKLEAQNKLLKERNKSLRAEVDRLKEAYE